MTNLEKKILNSIENAYNYMNAFGAKCREIKTHNGFTLLVEKHQITLIDQDIVVLLCDRGYLQLSQIVPLIAEIVEVWGECDRNIEIH